MRILMHVCCGPCSLYPLDLLRGEGHEVSGWFHNPNIHPYREFKARMAAVREVAARKNFPVEIDEHYGLTPFLRKVVYHEAVRCFACVDMRLESTVEKAKQIGAEGFTTSLLYSKYQNHAYIKKKGEELAAANNLSFVYEDFRLGWQEGIEQSLTLELYRQPYCGCIYSEQERYDKKMRKKISKSKI